MISPLPGLVPDHQLAQRFHGGRNLPRYVAVHLGQQILILLPKLLLGSQPLLLGHARCRNPHLLLVLMVFPHSSRTAAGYQNAA
jgi:hypothetical protein